MRVLVLSPYPSLLYRPIEEAGDTFISRLPDLEVSDWPEHDYLVSFGYRKIIPQERITQDQINIHLSLLPHNRGADPNFWSWFDNTPKGVTIHRMSARLDSGEVLAQLRIPPEAFTQTSPTLYTTYHDLLAAAAGLFARSWITIRRGDARPSPQGDMTAGSYHNSDERGRLCHLFPNGNKTSVRDVQTLGELYNGKTHNRDCRSR